MTDSSPNAAPYANERGGILVFLALVFTLALLLFAGTLKVVRASQAKIALQARLDLCAVKIAAEREAFLGQIAESNQYVQASVYAYYAGMALLLVPGAEEVGEAAMQAARTTNRALVAYQDGIEAVRQGKEVLEMKCEKTPFSETNMAFCLALPPLEGALDREATKLGAVKGRLKFRNKTLGKITCASGLTLTQLQLRGDPLLREKEFTDEYTQ